MDQSDMSMLGQGPIRDLNGLDIDQSAAKQRRSVEQQLGQWTNQRWACSSMTNKRWVWSSKDQSDIWMGQTLTNQEPAVPTCWAAVWTSWHASGWSWSCEPAPRWAACWDLEVNVYVKTCSSNPFLDKIIVILSAVLTNVIRDGDDDVLIVGIQADNARGELARHVLSIPDHLVLPPARGNKTKIYELCHRT